MGSLPHVVEDCFGIIQVFSDGSISRSNDIKLPFPSYDDGSILWKDCLYDKKNNLHLRLYKPPPPPTTTTKLPIIYFIHGGGFCLGSRTWLNCHNCCLRLSSGLQAIVISPDYRLAPEHKLPAAMDDLVSAVKWLESEGGSDKWLCCGGPGGGGVDLDRVFVMGDSSGGNIAHHLAVRFGFGSKELEQVRVRGYVLMAPFFGGTVRTKSEAEGFREPFLNLEALDRFWRLSLPAGENADHPFANPFGPDSPNLEKMKLDPMLVIAGGDELLKDRIEDYATRLKRQGKKIKYSEFEGKQHGFFTNESFSDVSNRVLQEIRDFMSENSY